jgi:hypothetical protein
MLHLHTYFFLLGLYLHTYFCFIESLSITMTIYHHSCRELPVAIISIIRAAKRVRDFPKGLDWHGHPHPCCRSKVQYEKELKTWDHACGWDGLHELEMWLITAIHINDDSLLSWNTTSNICWYEDIWSIMRPVNEMLEHAQRVTSWWSSAAGEISSQLHRSTSLEW